MRKATSLPLFSDKTYVFTPFYGPMAQNQNLSLEQRTQLRLSQQQLRFVRLLEDTAPEFDDAVARELEDNPALEAAQPDSDPMLTAEGERFTETSEQMQKADYLRTEDIPDMNRGALRDEPRDPFYSASDASESLFDYLSRQLADRDLDPASRAVAEYIIASIDSNGYLRRTPTELSDEMAFGSGIDASPREVEEVLEIVRSLDPPGVGAFDLRDTLLLQLRRQPQSQTRDDAIRIISEYFKEFSMKHTHALISGLKVGRERIDDALALILTLNPKPGSAFEGAGAEPSAIIPDFIVSVDEAGNISILLNNRIPELQVERSFEQAVAELTSAKGRVRRKGAEFIVDRTNDARDFIRIVRRRQETLMRVMTAIVEFQRAYFLSGDVYQLRPMLIKDLAERTGEDISVISRATKNKYAQTPYGILPLRFFFSDSIGEQEGKEEGKEALTNRKVEAAIKELVDAESKQKPLSDEKIHEELAKKGIDVSRRTIAKYRDRLGIPVARLRKSL